MLCKKLLFSLWGLFGLTQLGITQIGFGSKPINVQNANSLEFDESVSGAQRLIGNVVLEHDGTYLYCDSARLYETTNRLEAYSSVRIVSDSVRISGDRLTYDGKTKIADITGRAVRLNDASFQLTTNRLTFDNQKNIASYNSGGKITGLKNNNELSSGKGDYHTKEKTVYFSRNVVLKNQEFTVRCDTLKYNLRNETAYFIGPTTIDSKQNSIYCEYGFYNTKQDIAEFQKNARLTNNKQVLTADWIVFNQKTGKGKAKNNVLIKDTSSKVILTSNMADYDQKSGKILLSDSAVMQQIFAKDTLFLHGDTLVSISDENKNRRMTAFRHVKFFKNDFQGKADSLSYSDGDSLLRLFGNPVIWNAENQLSADSLNIQLANSELSLLLMRKNAFIISEVDELRFNQIKGNNITGRFMNSELRKVEVHGNGQSVYYVRDSKDELIGVNKIVCSSLNLLIDSNKVKEISFLNQPDATLYPMKEENQNELRLKGFQWMKADRPRGKSDIFKWIEFSEKPQDKNKKNKRRK